MKAPMKAAAIRASKTGTFKQWNRETFFDALKDRKGVEACLVRFVSWRS
jgi:hypothetical protein